MAQPDRDEQFEVILDTATRLFAALGYDSTSVREIAEAAGLDVETVMKQVGGKRDLYLAVIGRAFEEEIAALAPAAAEFEKTGSIHRLLDRYLDFYIEHPDIVALWIHRWLSDAADVAELESHYVQPLIAMVGEAVRNRLGDAVGDIDIEYTQWCVIWCVHGYVVGGVPQPDGRLHGPGNPQSQRRFRRTLHQMLHRHMRLPGDPPG